MCEKTDNKGVSLFELIIAMAIMAILVGTMTPLMIKYVRKARQVKIEKEASEFINAAQIAYVEVYINGKDPKGDSIKNIVKDTNSNFYRNGTKYGNLTNWTVYNGIADVTVDGETVAATNGPFADEFFGVLGIEYGKGVKVGSSVIPMAANGPKSNGQKGSLTKECLFQVFYDETGNMIIEYSREGYYVVMENSILMKSVKVEANGKYFTEWK